MFNGLRIRELLDEKGVQQNTFSVETGISKSNLWVWIEGKSKPGADALEKMADYFKVPTDYFFDRNIDLPNISIGHQVKGNGNKVSGDVTISECRKEIAHLNALIEEKERVINEKERIIQILMNK